MTIIKTSFTLIKKALCQRIRDGLTYTNKYIVINHIDGLTERNYTINSTDEAKFTFDKNLTAFLDKYSRENRGRGNISQHDKCVNLHEL